MQRLEVHANKRFLQTADGIPFFYLGDTAWELFHRCNHSDMDLYLRNRAAKGFTAIQAVLLAEVNGLSEPNANGDLAVIDKDPARPNDPYFAHVDETVRTAEALGMYMAILPTWGSWVVKQDFHPFFPPVQAFTPANAYAFGSYLGKRYERFNNIIWVMGGDRAATGYESVFEAMVKGIRECTGASHLFTYHPGGDTSSSFYWQNSDWIDFNMIQSGHSHRALRNWEMISHDYKLAPTQPTLDGEPCYEDMPIGFNAINGRFTDHDIRQAAYWSVFAGGCGYTYGCNNIWQMYDTGRAGYVEPSRTWKQSLNLPGSFQMIHLRRLIESRPFFSRIPDSTLAPKEKSGDSNHIEITRDGSMGGKDATYIMAYTPLSRGPEVDTSVIPGETLILWWFDPRSGIAYPAGDRPNTGKVNPHWHTLPWHLPQAGTDWVLVIDDASCGYGAPGAP